MEALLTKLLLANLVAGLANAGPASIEAEIKEPEPPVLLSPHRARSSELSQSLEPALRPRLETGLESNGKQEPDSKPEKQPAPASTAPSPPDEPDINAGGQGPIDTNPDDISPSTTTEDQEPAPKVPAPDQRPDRPSGGKLKGPLSPSGVIQYNVREKSPADGRKPVRGGISIFQALDEALVKSPRAAAMRSLLPVARAELARATEEAPPDFTYDNGVKAEQTRRIGTLINWEPPWKLVFRLLVAKRMVDQRKLDLMAELWKLRAEVRLAYTEVVVAQETLETLNSLYDLAHRLRVVSEKRFQAGDVPELDLLKARLAESQYDVERRVGLRRVIRAKQQLNVIMGRIAEGELTVPRLPPFLKRAEMRGAAEVKNPLLPDFGRQVSSLDNYLSLAMNHRYELKSLDRQIAVNKANLMKTYGDIVPTGQFWMGSSVAGNPPSGPKLSSYYWGFNLPTNITNFNQGDIAQYKAMARQLKYQVGALKNVITSEVSSAYNNLLAARQKLRVYEEHVLSDSYEVARLARRSYEVGQADITSTIQAQQNNVVIRTQYLEAIQLYQQAFTELERACGMPLLESEE